MGKMALSIIGERKPYPSVMIQYSDGSTCPLPHLVRHSLTGLEWGYGGSGPSDTALSMLSYVTKDKCLAERLYDKFKWAFIANQPHEGFVIPLVAIRHWVRDELS